MSAPVAHLPDWVLGPPACHTPGKEADPVLLAPLHSPSLHTAAVGSPATGSSLSTAARWRRVPDTLDLGRAPVATELAGCCRIHQDAAGRTGCVLRHTRGTMECSAELNPAASGNVSGVLPQLQQAGSFERRCGTRELNKWLCGPSGS